MRTVMLLVVAALATESAQAQGRRGTVRQTWLSASTGYMSMSDVDDGASESTWTFGDGYPIRLSVEREVANGASLGLQFSYARMPLVHYDWTSQSARNAHSTVATYGPIFRLGRGSTWYQVIEVFAGVMQYGNFTSDATGVTLAPTRPNRDFAFSLGTGFGYPLSRDWALELQANYISAFHERTNLPGDAPTARQHRSLMLALRMGL